MQTRVMFFGYVCKEQVEPCLVFYSDAAVQMQIPELLCQDFSPSALTSTQTHISTFTLPCKLNTDELQREPHLIGSEN